MPDIALELDVPFHVFAAKDKDEFRKPDTGMWDIYVKSFNDGIAVGKRFAPRCWLVKVADMRTT